MDRLIAIFEQHNNQIVLISGKVCLLLGIVSDDEDVYYVTQTSEGEFSLFSALNIFIPLKERLTDVEYKFFDEQLGQYKLKKEDCDYLLANLLTEHEILAFVNL